MSKKRALNPNQTLFVKEYLISRNATDAYRKVYKVSAKVAGTAGPRLLENVGIQDAIDQGTKKLHQKLDLKAEDVLLELKRMGMVNMALAFNDDGSMKKISEMPEEVQRSLHSIDTQEIYEGHGQDRVYIGDLKKIKLHDKTVSLNLLGRHLKLFTDVIEHKDGDGLAARMAAARKRKK